ncbi:outer membrane receptor for ferrienterochelin and colicin [Blastomonas natatoria]|uniref:Outer membrane receptor for ferrienterochelin and colicin n=1 Tax=Blastomonas natatoria TaxID=34015 RepID=A0A2V3UQD4_9SPHN|nr:TonB-dependent receptor [Blastomonas natatoria]PXW69489.1 outer membrane receptor for ferrienterochelin and colicin [Blastomonas natatoria]
MSVIFGSVRATRVALCASIAGLAMLPALAMAQENVAAEEQPRSDAEGAITTSQDIVVQGQIGYRNRVDGAEPVLEYGTEYFQRFEPLTAGDALKRVPSVTFLSDVIESDGPRLRGLPPGYTQILINGERVPGGQADRSFFLDRIPAELISRVEIVRSNSARRTGDAVAGSLNIVLRDGYQLDGGYVRGGTLYYDDEEFEPSFGAVFGGKVGPGRLLIGGNFQGRHNPKLKSSLRYGDSPENNPNFATDDFDNREDQTDTRDGKDYSLNATYEIDGGDTNFQIRGFYVRTDRTETERSYEYDDPTAITGPVPAGNLLTDNANVNEIDQENYTIDGKLSHEWSAGKTSLRIGYANFTDKQRETEFEIDFDRATPRFTGDLTATDIDDSEFTVKLEHAADVSDEIKLVFGGFYQDKDRDTAILTVRNRFNVAAARNWNQFQRNPEELNTGFGALDETPGGVNAIEERRIDGFALIEGRHGGFSWEAGLRYETTDLNIVDATVAVGAVQGNDYEKLLPSASFKYDITDRDRIIGSVARTNRRPEFNFISPALLEAELGDNDLLGNPQLDPETAWGIDLGYERRIGRGGIVGINFFYRDVKNLIELTNTGVEGSEGDGTFVFQPLNVGDGKVYGVEFDMSTDLGFLGLPDTGIFGNVSYLDSEITDIFGERRFNDQSKFVYNFGAIQDLKSIGAAFGATYRKQGRAFGRVIGEEVTTTYGADLEIFIEKRFGKSFTIRAVGSNLLNGKKREVFNKFTTVEDQIDRSFDEYELESEEAGPVFQVIARYAF